jgi:lincosamide nucleotidyltransferase A/C/D/E
MSAQEVAEVCRGLEAHGVTHWVCGGWGVDALAGRQTRRHGDLDVIVDRAEPRLDESADAALTELGLRRVGTETSIPPMSTIWVYSDGRNRTVDLLPVDVTAAPFDRADAWAQGRIAEIPVRCISAALQRRLRTGYSHRRSDRADMAVLDELASS